MSKAECSMESSLRLPFELDFLGKEENIFSQYFTPHTSTLVDPMGAVGADTSWPQSATGIAKRVLSRLAWAVKNSPSQVKRSINH